jgi:uncharacterized protein DUF2442
MRSARPGKSTSVVEVGNVSPHGFWLLIGDQERFVSFKDFPWFREASIRELTNVELPSPRHLHWPDLDVDVAVESLDYPERYPLVSRTPNRRLKPSASAFKESKARYKRRAGGRRG